MEKKDFEEKIGKIFSVKLSGGLAADLKLKSVDSLKKAEGIPELEGGLKLREAPFSLVFTGSDEQHLPDNTYTMSIEDWENQLIFISAFKDDGDGNIHYDSVFN